ncbi:MAG TPA: DUF2589 domain-containing protein [Myxococcaceae bacterium]|nr:DUF2589 domain-containing protein [Myxococcaceae bacterium]
MSHGSDEDAHVKVPWLAVIRPNQLAIKDLQIDMEVGLVDFTPREGEAPAPPSKPGEIPQRDGSGTLHVDVASAMPSDKRSTAKIVLRVEGHEPSEGLARMIHELVKRIRTEE